MVSIPFCYSLVGVIATRPGSLFSTQKHNHSASNIRHSDSHHNTAGWRHPQSHEANQLTGQAKLLFLRHANNQHSNIRRFYSSPLHARIAPCSHNQHTQSMLRPTQRKWQHSKKPFSCHEKTIPTRYSQRQRRTPPPPLWHLFNHR